MAKLVTPKRPSTKKPVSNVKSKQSSITSFFQIQKKPTTAEPVIEKSKQEEKPINSIGSSPIRLGRDGSSERDESPESPNTSVEHTKTVEISKGDKPSYSSPSAKFNDLDLSSSDSPDTPDTSLEQTRNESTAKPSLSSPTAELDNLELSSTKRKKITEMASSPLSRRSAIKKVSYEESSDEDEEDDIKPKKRKRVVYSDDEDEDFTPVAVEEEEDDVLEVEDEDIKTDASDVEMADVISDDETISKKSQKKSNRKTSPKTSSATTTRVALNANNGATSLSKFSSTSDFEYTKIEVTQPRKLAKTAKNFVKENEERYSWLLTIKDAQGRTEDDPEYDARTLFIPKSAWAKFTAFEKQYWEIKSQMWNTVVFFKKGKFYELYENDAMIAHTEFSLRIAGGGRANMKLAGIPEMSFEDWAKRFIENGYKVAKVDQKESLLAKEIREKDGGVRSKEEKVIKRELSSILTAGTLTDLSMINDDLSIYCLSIKEEELPNGDKVFGVCFVDTASSEINYIQFEDDKECSRLDTIITQIKPKEIITEKSNLTSLATKVVKFNSAHQPIWNDLNPLEEFWDYDTTYENLVRSKYFKAQDLDDLSSYPANLIDLKDNYKVAFNAFGGLLFYLKSLKLDESIISLGNIREYDMVKKSTSLILDGITLSNLEIFSNTFDGSDKGSLFRMLNRAITPMGKRKLKTWILHPLLDPKAINGRFDSIQYVMDSPDFRDDVENVLGSLPDLERLIARVHSGTLKFSQFLKVIQAFEKINSMVSVLQAHPEVSGCLSQFINNFPTELNSAINEWEEAFDRDEALNEVIVPQAGVDEEFDQSNKTMKDLEDQLNTHLREYRKTYKSQEICYKDSGKEIFLIEVPTKVKNIPKNWQQMAATAKVKRYWSPEVRVIVRSLMEQRELHKSINESLRSNMYKRFDKNYPIWMETINSLSNIDCIMALTRASESIGYPSCRPEFIESTKGELEFKDLRHPCFAGTKDFIPNDVRLGGDSPSVGLLTGANAAGKSTIMRTTALAVILSQIGCFVPSESARLTPVDRIMTRLGANDNLMQGKSTFLVELSETKKIIENSTPKSLVILDELGRGGSSSDGFAIAESVLHHLTTHIQSLGFFATHYGTLGLSFETHPQVKQLRMAILAEKGSRDITFLYKLEEGKADGSFGMNVAAMCGIDSDIVDKAEVAAKDYEHTSKLKRVTESILKDIGDSKLTLGLQSDIKWFANEYKALSKEVFVYDENVRKNALQNVLQMIDEL